MHNINHRYYLFVLQLPGANMATQRDQRKESATQRGSAPRPTPMTADDIAFANGPLAARNAELDDKLSTDYAALADRNAVLDEKLEADYMALSAQNAFLDGELTTFSIPRRQAISA